MSFLISRMDKSHPHHFTYSEVIHLVEESALKIVRVDKKNIGRGNFIRRFMSWLHISFKVAVASLLVFNAFIVAKKENTT